MASQSSLWALEFVTMSKRKAVTPKRQVKTAKRTKQTKAAKKKSGRSVKTVKTTKTAKTTDGPTLDIPDEPQVDLPSKNEPKESYRMVAKRIWYCQKHREGCQGAAPFLGWQQLMDQPTCPNCGGAMRWRWWGEKQHVESVRTQRPARSAAARARM